MTATLANVPQIAPGFRLQWEPAQDCHVLLYPEGMVKLNRSAGDILERCDGRHTVQDIVAELQQRYGATGLEHDIRRFVELAAGQRWLVWSPS
jgi:pyrroloquinoline quinone biosynthesis protein D